MASQPGARPEDSLPPTAGRIASLRRELGAPAETAVDFADLRQRLAWILTGLRHQRARESDLIYEAYYEGFPADLGKESGESSPQWEE